MELIDAIRRRRSIRGFKPDPVPREIVARILELATRSPSGMNHQPWEITVLTGRVLDNVRQGIVQMLVSGVAPNPEVVYRRELTGVFRERQIALAIQLHKLMGIERNDKRGRGEWDQRGSRFFDAPVAIILSYDESVDEPRALYPLGLFTQTLCLAALEFNLGTCIERQGAMYPDVIRRYVDIPKSKRIAIAIALGYPDEEFPANRAVSEREPLDRIARWYGYD